MVGDSRDAAPRRYWLWVTGPDYYLDEDGEDREDLDPDVHEEEEGGWWTCHAQTGCGDLVLLWRTAPRKDIGYLIQTMSDAYGIGDDPHASAAGWDWGCDYRPLYKFDDRITIAGLREHDYLARWTPLRMNFRRRVFEVDLRDWRALCELAMGKELSFREFVADSRRRGLPIVPWTAQTRFGSQHRLIDPPLEFVGCGKPHPTAEPRTLRPARRPDATA